MNKTIKQDIMKEKQPIRILHFSDFHLNGKYVEDAKTLLQNMLDAIKKANQQIKIWQLFLNHQHQN